MRLALSLIIPACLVVAQATTVRAQEQAAADSLRLGTLHQQAVASDPRQRQFELLTKQTELRLKNLSAERYPMFTAEGLAQYQTDVFAPPPSPGSSFPAIPKDNYDGRISVDQPILDPTISVRKRVEEAQLAESQAEVMTALFSLREQVNEAFFNAALLAESSRIIAATIAELESQLAEARIRVREGDALPSDTAAVQATLLERRQDAADVAAKRLAALIRLTNLVRHSVTGAEYFVLPDLTEATVWARENLDSIKSRPEYAQFERNRELLVQQEEAVFADQKLRLSAFGHAGYGNPGLNALSGGWDTYFMGGLQVKWSPWNWGSTGREKDAIAVQRQIVTSEEEAFTGQLTRDIQNDLADIDRLDTALALDDQIVELRHRVEAETRIRFREGVVTGSEYVDRSTDVLSARLAQATHRIEQVRASAHLLTTLGLEIR